MKITLALAIGMILLGSALLSAEAFAKGLIVTGGSLMLLCPIIKEDL